jgi:hypothetical protein
MRWELLRSALSVLTLDWGLARDEKIIHGRLRMVSNEYLLVKGATPIAANFPVEISGLTEDCLRRQRQGIITKVVYEFQQKICNIYFMKLISLEDMIHSAHVVRCMEHRG